MEESQYIRANNPLNLSRQALKFLLKVREVSDSRPEDITYMLPIDAMRHWPEMAHIKTCGLYRKVLDELVSHGLAEEIGFNANQYRREPTFWITGLVEEFRK